MVVGAKVCDLTEDWFVCGLYVLILTSSHPDHVMWV